MRRNLSTERYIRAATRGLRGQVRLDVQLELRHHLHERVGQLKAEGLREDQALEQTLLELGSVGQVRRALWSVHPPLHLLVGAVLCLLLGWTLWGLREVQTGRDLNLLLERTGYGRMNFMGNFPGGLELREWAARLPPGLRVEGEGAGAVLVHERLGRLPLSGGSSLDRPLLLYTQNLIPYSDFVSIEPSGQRRYSKPAWTTGLERVRGPYLNFSNLALRAFEAGWPVGIQNNRLTLGAVAVPGTEQDFLDWTGYSPMKLAVAQLRSKLPRQERQTPNPYETFMGFEFMLSKGSSVQNPGEPAFAAVMRGEPGASYVMVGRIAQYNSLEGVVEWMLMTSRPLKADSSGIVRLPRMSQQGRNYLERARVYGQVGAWVQADLSRQIPVLLVRTGPEYGRNRPLELLSPPGAVELSFALSQE